MRHEGEADDAVFVRACMTVGVWRREGERVVGGAEVAEVRWHLLFGAMVGKRMLSLGRKIGFD